MVHVVLVTRLQIKTPINELIGSSFNDLIINQSPVLLIILGEDVDGNQSFIRLPALHGLDQSGGSVNIGQVFGRLVAARVLAVHPHSAIRNAVVTVLFRNVDEDGPEAPG